MSWPVHISGPCVRVGMTRPFTARDAVVWLILKESNDFCSANVHV